MGTETVPVVIGALGVIKRVWRNKEERSQGPSTSVRYRR